MTLRLQGNAEVIEDLARRTAAPIELVKNLYEDEVTKLRANASIDRYIPVIATQRVRRRLRSRHPNVR